jgi:hypothetical protein
MAPSHRAVACLEAMARAAVFGVAWLIEAVSKAITVQ